MRPRCTRTGAMRPNILHSRLRPPHVNTTWCHLSNDIPRVSANVLLVCINLLLVSIKASLRDTNMRCNDTDTTNHNVNDDPLSTMPAVGDVRAALPASARPSSRNRFKIKSIEILPSIAIVQRSDTERGARDRKEACLLHRVREFR